MKIQQKTITKSAAIFTALFLLASNFPALTVNADNQPEETAIPPESVAISEEEAPQETQALTEELTTEEVMTTTYEELPQEITMITEEETCISSDETVDILQEFTDEEDSVQSDESALPETADITQNLSDEECSSQSDETAPLETAVLSEKALVFHANVEYSPEGYRVMGTFTEFPPDIVQIQPLYSKNNKSYQECGVEWDLEMIEAYHIAETKRLICLFFNNDPLKSYLDGSLDCFYLKLHLTDKNDILYETQTVLIDRGAPQPLPEEITPSAWFASNIRVRQIRPLRYYGRYQITIKETAAPKEISAVLPDTLPVEVQFMKGKNPYATGIINCPVTWKPLSLPSLTAGESVIIEDAAEEIIVPAGTSVRTPVGVFRLDKSLSIESEFASDEVRLVLNVVSKDEKPTGALTAERDGLELAFHLKPTGAASIQTYVISENEKKWKKLPKRCGLAVLDAVNAQPSTANSGYALVLDNEQEPYRSYLAAQAQGTQPTPFFVGLKIKGGVYDGQELILAYPNTYDKPLNLPKFGGMGGNEGNAGATNKGDSTPEGQRPILPQNTGTKKEEQTSTLSLIRTPENITMENMAELPTQPDIEEEQTPESKQADAFIQPPVKAQAAITQISEENNLESDTAADMQTAALTESTTVPETVPATNKLSAGLVSSSQSEETDHTDIHPLFLLIMTVAIIVIGITFYIRKTADT